MQVKLLIKYLKDKYMKYFLYYGRGLDVNNMEFIGEFNSIDDCDVVVINKIKKMNLKHWYIRKTYDKDIIWYDYGSYTKFFMIKKTDLC